MSSLDSSSHLFKMFRRLLHRTGTNDLSSSAEQISNYCINARRRDIKSMREEAGLSPRMPSESTPNGEIINRRKRRSSDESSDDGQVMVGDADKRRRRH